ncbi:MAG TPA: ComEC/Rec2 family competence protein [Dermatophilaceae bacterium]|nr:ComEC/Rec2 family competence protein [Dermatophilaceae bacterium]
MLLPALVSWAAVAGALSWSPPTVVRLGLGCTAGGILLLLVSVRPGVATCDVPLARLPAEPGRSRRRRARLSLTLLLTGASLLAVAAHLTIQTAGLVPELAAERATATLDAVVSADPRRLPSHGPAAEPLVLVRLTVERVSGRGSRSGAASPVLLFGDPSWLSLRWQERVRVVGRLAPSDGGDVVAVVTPIRPYVVLEQPGWVAVAAEHVRSGLRDAANPLPADARGLLPGLVIGDRSRTPPGLTAAMQQTGLSHLDAVSGSNVTMVLAAGLSLCRLIGIARRWRPFVALVVLAGFVVVARPEPSVLRAAAMGAVGLAGMLGSRRRVGLPALSAAVVLLLWTDPWLARSYGFALSALATLGLLVFARPWGDWFAARLPRRLRWFGPALAIPVAAQVVCGPVAVLLQGSVSLIGIPANLMAAPLVGPATVLGVAAALVALVSAPAAVALAWPAGMAAQGIAVIARTAADAPMGQLPWPAGVGGSLLLAGASLTLLVGWPWLARLVRQRPLRCLAAVALATAAAWPTTSVGWPPSRWQFVACDVGQGDGLVLAAGPGRAVVVDTGPDPALIDRCLDRLGVQVVEAVVITHFHADHVDGLPGVIRGRRVGQVLVGPVDDPPFQVREVLSWAGHAGIPVRRLLAGDRVRWGDVAAEVIWPARVLHDGSVPNNASLVLSASVGRLRLMLLGDVEVAAAHQVLLDLRRRAGGDATAQVDVLKVAHHGSRLQDDGLLAAVAAPLAVISVGAGNSYGHPSPRTLDQLRWTGHTVLRTDEAGDIAVDRDDRGLVRVLTSRRPP